MALFIEVGPGDRLIIGGSVIHVGDKTGRKTRLRIDTTADVKHEKATPVPAHGQGERPGITRPNMRSD